MYLATITTYLISKVKSYNHKSLIRSFYFYLAFSNWIWWM